MSTTDTAAPSAPNPASAGLDQPMVLPVSRRHFRQLVALAAFWLVYDQRNGIATLISDLLTALG